MKPAQKLKGARLEAGQTQERDDASLLAHREESKDAVKSRRAFLRFVLVTVYLVVWGVSVLAFWMGGRTDAMGYSLVVFYAVLPLSTLVLSFFIGCGRAWDGCKRTMLFFFGAMSMLGPYVTFSLSNMASFQKFNLPELSAFLPGLLCAVAGMAVGAAVRAAKRKRACPRYPGMKKPQRQQALRLHVLLCSQCNLRFWKHLGYTPRFKTAWVLVPFPYFRNTGFCISYF